MNKIIKKTLKVVFPIILGTFILFWVYRDFDFSRAADVFLHQMSWWWMFLTLIFGILSHVFRGVRWKQTLEPMGYVPKTNNCINAIFISYAANLVLPRVGEVSRCGILTKYDGIPFAKSLGTVVAERMVDTFMVVFITGITIVLQLGVFRRFFLRTGTNIDAIGDVFSSMTFWIVLMCIVGIGIMLYYLLRSLTFFQKVKGLALNVWEGVRTLKHVRNMPLFILYTLLIWLCYFLQFYLAFFSFGFTSNLSFLAGMVMFAAGSIAVVVPTPNGAGPWHFAIITMMCIYGVDVMNAGIFALLVHSIQTLLVVILGVYGLAILPFTNKK
jgi:glycosyltransferase 2 family protein